MMTTLYDLLGALPDDGAEDLRSAFRRAVKGAHPDIHPDDPHAALKFRRIVRANEILGDAEQRAAYDHLLDLAHLEQEQSTGHATAAKIHKLASGVIALAGASVVTVSGYLLFMHMSAASVPPADRVAVAARASTEVVAASPAPSSNTTGKNTSLAKREHPSVPGEAIAPGVALPGTNGEGFPAADVGSPLDLAASAAASVRARGISARRPGHPGGAIAEPAQAIQPDPKFSVAYNDRGVIFYRLRSVGRTFADIAPPNRIETASRAKAAPTMARKPRLDQAPITPSMTPLPRRRPAGQEPSREESVALVRLR